MVLLNRFPLTLYIIYQLFFLYFITFFNKTVSVPCFAASYIGRLSTRTLVPKNQISGLSGWHLTPDSTFSPANGTAGLIKLRPDREKLSEGVGGDVQSVQPSILDLASGSPNFWSPSLSNVRVFVCQVSSRCRCWFTVPFVLFVPPKPLSMLKLAPSFAAASENDNPILQTPVLTWGIKIVHVHARVL